MTDRAKEKAGILTRTYCLSLDAPIETAEVFERALETLGGALAIGTADDGGLLSLAAYLPEAPDEPRVHALLTAAALVAGVPMPAWKLEALRDVDWVSESQKGLPALRAGRFYLYGSHVAEAPPPGRIALLIEANAAFGTGRHESTFGCLMALSHLAKDRRFGSVLDLGAGSGVLAMAAAKLWRTSVLAVERDPVAVGVARENVRINGLSSYVTLCRAEGYRSRSVRRAGPFDLVCANILAAPLIAMANDLARCLAPGGVAILSGILREQAQAVLARHRGAELIFGSRISFGDWSTLVLRKKKVNGAAAGGRPVSEPVAFRAA